MADHGQGSNVIQLPLDDVATHWCSGCQADKPLTEFYPGKSLNTQYHCRECHKARQRRWRHANPERQKRYKLASVARSFGLTPAQYDALLAKQKGRCGICRKKPKKGEPRLHIDHDHATGLVRGLLCSHCNLRLAWFEEHAAAAGIYLAAPPAKGIR